MARKKAGLPAVEQAIETARVRGKRRKATDKILNAPAPTLERLADILRATEREREREGLPPSGPDPVIDRAAELSERAWAIEGERAADRERARAGVIEVDRGAYPDDAEGYWHALARADALASARIGELRARSVYLTALVEGPSGGR